MRALQILKPLNPQLASWEGRRVWLVGASTGIGRAVAAELHAKGARVCVSARRAAALDEFVAAHPGATALALDASDAARVRAAADELMGTGPLDLVVYCAGHFKEQGAADFDLREMVRHLDVNYVGALNVLDATLPRLRRQGHGHVSLMGSVAGWRGLPRSLAYGPTKAALINLAESLYIELRAVRVGVSIVNPGFVDTPLTAQNRFHMPALIGPDEAAREVIAGWERGQFEIHFPRRFTWPMKLLAALPFRLYQALVRRRTLS